jgi:hypothetical protein
MHRRLFITELLKLFNFAVALGKKIIHEYAKNLKLKNNKFKQKKKNLKIIMILNNFFYQ